MMSQDLARMLCGAFRIEEDGKVLLVHTPFGLDYSDELVLRVRYDEQGWRVDDNGETMLALALAGADPDNARVLEVAEGIELNEDDGSLIRRTDELGLADAVFAVMEASLRVHAACRPRQRPSPSDLKERVIDLLFKVSEETGARLLIDQVVEETGSLTADAVLGDDSDPLIVITATSVERLMEAELMYLRRQITRRPGYVCAVVPSAKAIGQKHFSRANYYTDKAVEFDEWTGAFREFALQRVASLH